jgi:hypothetical protein
MFLERHRHDGYTIRWRRGDRVTYALAGKQVDDYGMSEVLV